jgi:hypothetical protein
MGEEGNKVNSDSETDTVKQIDFEKDVKPSIDALFTGKYDISVKPAEGSDDAVCNVSLILRVLLIEMNGLNKKMEKCMCNK